MRLALPPEGGGVTLARGGCPPAAGPEPLPSKARGCGAGGGRSAPGGGDPTRACVCGGGLGGWARARKPSEAGSPERVPRARVGDTAPRATRA